MTNETLKESIVSLHPSAVFEDGEWLNVLIPAAECGPLMRALHDDTSLDLDFLFCLTCIDWKTHLTVVYHLTSRKHHHSIVVKARVDRELPMIQTVSHLWKTAIFHEREVYEMFGVTFLNHPDLRLLILPDGWEGRNPLRKDFEDPVNMIRL